MSARLPMGAPPSVIGVTISPSVAPRTAPPDAPRREAGRRCPADPRPPHESDEIGPLIVDRDGRKLERLRDVPRDRAVQRRAAFPQQERPAERVQALEIALASHGFDRPLSGPARQLARHDRGQQERRERDPVLRVRDRQGADRRQKEEVEAEHGHDRGERRLADSPRGRDEQNRDDVRQRDGGGIDAAQQEQGQRDECHCPHRYDESNEPDASRHVVTKV